MNKKTVTAMSLGGALIVLLGITLLWVKCMRPTPPAPEAAPEAPAPEAAPEAPAAEPAPEAEAEGPVPEPIRDYVVERMNEPAYLKLLERVGMLQMEAKRKARQAGLAYEQAKAAGVEGDELARLEAAWKAAGKEFAELQALAALVIREKMEEQGAFNKEVLEKLMRQQAQKPQ